MSTLCGSSWITSSLASSVSGEIREVRTGPAYDRTVPSCVARGRLCDSATRMGTRKVVEYVLETMSPCRR